ncbi:unnamed protein product [Sphagnum troendelagicum]|uniref:Glyoxal oxidase n=1 Tax=Sphagnum troendelagicum TaxID=128251 RepID=A0ABP0URW2_9BRYO
MAGGRCSSHPLKIFRVLLVLEIMTAVGLVPDDVVSLTGRFRLVLAQGSWEVLVQNAGISSMHTAVTHFGNVVLLDRTNIGPSQLPLNGGRCRANPADRVSQQDCTAHSAVFTPGSNSIRPLFIFTDTWCSSGQFIGDGTLVQTGGDSDGFSKIRAFAPCGDDGECDWVESTDTQLQNGRWYATNQLLADGRQIVVGGRNVFTLEYVPANGQGAINLPLLTQTDDGVQYDNLYPYLHLLPNNQLFIFANRDSILYDWQTDTVVRSLPTIPGEPRNYPAAGSSVMLPLTSESGWTNPEILVCGGAPYGAYLNPAGELPASQTCGRIAPLAGAAVDWAMETMPMRRNMGDMVLLPTRDVLIVNGAGSGAQGWGNAQNPVQTPVLYHPQAAAGTRFQSLTASDIPRVYHSTANLLPDARILVAGSNTHEFYTLTGDLPTELRIEAFSPPYLAAGGAADRPRFIDAPASLAYAATFTVTVATAAANPTAMELNLASAAFVTHSFGQGQRLLKLGVLARTNVERNQYAVTSTAPPNAVVAPSSYYMLFAVDYAGVPSIATWVKIG